MPNNTVVIADYPSANILLCQIVALYGYYTMYTQWCYCVDLSSDLLSIIKWMIHPQPQLRYSIQQFTIIYWFS